MEKVVVAASVRAAGRCYCGRVFILGSVEIACGLHLFSDSVRCRPVVSISSHSHSTLFDCRRIFVPPGSAELAFPRPLLSSYAGCIRDDGPNLFMRFSLVAAGILSAFCYVIC